MSDFEKVKLPDTDEMSLQELCRQMEVAENLHGAMTCESDKKIVFAYMVEIQDLIYSKIHQQ